MKFFTIYLRNTKKIKVVADEWIPETDSHFIDWILFLIDKCEILRVDFNEIIGIKSEPVVS